MKLALVIERFDAEGGGAERSTAQIAQLLLDRGHQVTVLAGSCCLRPIMPQVEVVSLFPSKRVGGGALLKLERWVRQELAAGRYDASLSVTTVLPAAVLQPRGGTVAETLLRNVALRRSAMLRTLKRIVIATSPKHRMLLSMEKRTLRNPMIKRIVAVSRYVAQQLTHHYGINPSRVDVIPNGAQMPVIDSAERLASRRRIRNGLDLRQDLPVYLFAAHNPRLKGAEPLLRAVRRLKDRGVNITLLLVGRHSYTQRRMAVRLGLHKSVRFLGMTHRMVDLYAASDVTVLPTYYDPASKVIIESLMMGVPAITTVFNGASDLVVGPDHAARGRVISDPSAVEDLANAMAEMADSAQRNRCAQAAAGIAESLSMRRHVDSLEAVLAAVGPSPDPPRVSRHLQSNLSGG